MRGRPLSISRLLSEPTLLTDLPIRSPKPNNLAPLHVTHQTELLIQINLHQRSAYIMQLKGPCNTLISREHPLFPLLFRAPNKLFAAIYDELVKRYQSVEILSTDMRNISVADDMHFTHTGEEKPTPMIRPGDVLLNSGLVKLAPADITVQRLEFLASLETVTLDCTALFDDPSPHAQDLRASLSRLYADLIITSPTVSITQDRFPKLSQLSRIACPNATEVTVDLPHLMMVRKLTAPSAEKLSLNLPNAHAVGSIEAPMAKHITARGPRSLYVELKPMLNGATITFERTSG